MPIFLLLLLLCQTVSTAAVANERYFRNLLDSLHQELRPQIMVNRPPSERQRVEMIDIELTDNFFARGMAFADKKNQKIVISTGFMWGLLMYSEAFLIEAATGRRNFREWYFSYLLWRHPAFWDIEKGGVPKQPGEYYGLNASTISNILNDPKLDIRRVFSSAVTEVYLHELGHFAKNLFYTSFSSNSLKRKQEISADEWASSASSSLGESSGFGKLIALGYLNELERFSEVQREQYRSHPSVGARFEGTVEHWCSMSGDVAAKMCKLYRSELNFSFSRKGLLKRYTKRKEDGESFASLMLGNIYLAGRITPRDRERACVNYTIAYVARRRDQAAMNYAWCLANGIVHDRNIPKARSILKAEFDRGWLDAKRLLNDLQ